MEIVFNSSIWNLHCAGNNDSCIGNEVKEEQKLSKKWYVMESNDINDPFPVKWKPVYDVRYVEFEKDFVVAVVRDLNDERLVYCVHPALVKCVKVKDE